MIQLPFTSNFDAQQAEGLQSFAETLAYITAEVYGIPGNYGAFTKQYAEDTTGYIDRLNVLIDWAIQFEQQNAAREWDGDYMEALDAFIAQKLA